MAQIFDDDLNADNLNGRKFQDSKEYKLAEAFTDAVNGSFNVPLFIRAMSKMHRELQSQSAIVMLRWIEAVGKDDYGTDGRNEWIKKYAAAIEKAGL